jgi:hypothetical protein
VVLRLGFRSDSSGDGSENGGFYEVTARESHQFLLIRRKAGSISWGAFSDPSPFGAGLQKITTISAKLLNLFGLAGVDLRVARQIIGNKGFAGKFFKTIGFI